MAFGNDLCAVCRKCYDLDVPCPLDKLEDMARRAPVTSCPEFMSVELEVCIPPSVTCGDSSLV